MKTRPALLTYYSDLLCIWAHAAQIRLDELVSNYGSDIRIETRFCSVFPDAHSKIKTQWAGKGEFEGFGAHIQTVAAQFPHLTISERLWREVRPRGSGNAHLYLCALRQQDADEAYPAKSATRGARALRTAFFERGEDISDTGVIETCFEAEGFDVDAVRLALKDGSAMAVLTGEYAEAARSGISGSPTYLIDKGRQRLWGNVGYRVIDANIAEVLHEPNPGEASWC